MNEKDVSLTTIEKRISGGYAQMAPPKIFSNFESMIERIDTEVREFVKVTAPLPSEEVRFVNVDETIYNDPLTTLIADPPPVAAMYGDKADVHPTVLKISNPGRHESQ